MFTNGMIKIIGIATSIIGLGATLVGDWADEKKMDKKIEEKVNAALSKKEEEESE